MSSISMKIRIVSLTLLLCAAAGCQFGKTKADEKYYLRATNGRETNYFKITVKARSDLAKAEFRHGWFPRSAVDSLFGKVTQEDEVDAVLAREQLREQIDKAFKKKQAEYLAELMEPFDEENPDARNEKLQRLLEDINRIRAHPGPRAGLYGDDVTLMEYDPRAGLVTERSDEKLVLFMSADPDEVVGKIAGFTEEAQTTKTVRKFGKLLVGREAAKQVEAASQNELALQQSRDIAAAVKEATDEIKAAPRDRKVVTQALQKLITFLDALE